jgi:hypothetical protein
MKNTCLFIFHMEKNEVVIKWKLLLENVEDNY